MIFKIIAVFCAAFLFSIAVCIGIACISEKIYKER